jgi:uncharacterized membrane protein
MQRRERGSVTMWGIGMALILFGFAGLVVDTWRVFAERQDLAGMADAAVIAGATAVDVAEFRASGTIRLDPATAETRARAYLARQDTWDPAEISATVVAAPDGSQISVTLEKDVDFTLLGFFLPGEAPLRITIPATANPNEIGP